MPIGTSADIFRLLTSVGVSPAQARTTAGGIGGGFTPEEIEASRRHFEDLAQAGRQGGVRDVALASALMLGGGALAGAGGAGELSTVALPDIASVAPSTVAAGGATTGSAATAALPSAAFGETMASLPAGPQAATSGNVLSELFGDFNPPQLGSGGGQPPQAPRNPVVALQRDPLAVGRAPSNGNRAQILAQALRSQGELAGRAERDARRIRERSALAAMLGRMG